MKMNRFALVLVVLFLIISNTFAQNFTPINDCANLKVEHFNKIINGKQVSLYFLKRGNISVAITNYGGRIVSVCTPDKFGNKADVVLGFNSIDDYLKATGIYQGAIIGRVAGRIANGTFDLDGKTISLPINSAPNHQHGGVNGFHNQVWDVQSVSDSSIVLTYFSPDGEMGYPGNLKVEATYSVTENDELTLEFSATTDKTTPINLTNHAFFNLAGEGNGSILNHQLTIPSQYFCVINKDKIKTGEIRKVQNTPFDFRIAKSIGKDLIFENTEEQLKIPGGYDQSYVLKKKPSNKLILAAKVFEPKSGRQLTIFTTNNGVHFFSGNFFKGVDIGKMGKPFHFRESFALETQDYNSPIPTQIASVLLYPGEKYEKISVYRFSSKTN
jgi:aldose 1-epimerase